MRCSLPESMVTTASPGSLLFAALHDHQRFAIGIPGHAGHAAVPNRRPGRVRRLCAPVPPSAGITMYCVFPSSIRRKASVPPSGDHTGATSLPSPLVNCCGLPEGSSRTKMWNGADLGALARAVGHALAIGRERRVRLGFLAGRKLHALLRHLRSGGQVPHQGHQPADRTQRQHQHDRRTAEEFPKMPIERS